LIIFVEPSCWTESCVKSPERLTTFSGNAPCLKVISCVSIMESDMFIFCDVAIIKYNLSESVRTEAPDYGPCLQWLEICAVLESQWLESDANYAGEDDWLLFRGLVPENFSSAVI
jgi:hypothetical protein